MLKFLRRLFCGVDLVDIDYIKEPYLGDPLEPISDKMETVEEKKEEQIEPIVIPENPDIKVETIELDENNQKIPTEAQQIVGNLVQAVIDKKEETFLWTEWAMEETYKSVKDLKKKSRSSKKATE